MIKVKKGEAKLKGRPSDILTELSIAIRGTVDALEENGIPHEVAVASVKKSVELAFKTREELEQEAKQKIGELLMHLGESMVDDSEEEGEQ